MRKIRKLFIANRGEIARRIARTCRTLGIVPLGLTTLPGERHASELDEAPLVVANDPRAPYLDGVQLVALAKKLGADAVHPGYGFLSEQSTFSELVTAAGLIFVGPSREAMERVGDKLRVKELARSLGIPVLTPTPLTPPFALPNLELPFVIKAAAGGGGRGMRVVRSAEQFVYLAESARREAESSFGDGRLYGERLIEGSRHVEVQIVADAHGSVRHLFERDCTLQRNHQKVIEEAPAPGLPESVAAKLRHCGEALLRAAHYVGVGTVEFLVRGEEFFLLEVNARLQVEHTVTEEISGLDLVALQLAIAAGERLPHLPESPRGHAIQLRLCAEDPSAKFLGSTGKIEEWHPPQDTRVDSGYESSDLVSGAFDSLLAKIIAAGSSRSEALLRAREALTQFSIGGIATNKGYLRTLLHEPSFEAVQHTTATAPRIAEELTKDSLSYKEQGARAAFFAALLVRGAKSTDGSWSSSDSFRLHGSTTLRGAYEVNGTCVPVVVTPPIDATLHWDGIFPVVVLDGVSYRVVCGSEGVWVDGGSFHGVCRPIPFPVNRPARSRQEGGSSEVRSHLPGKVVAFKVPDGEEVSTNTPLVVLESMKMEHEVVAPRAGKVRYLVGVGAQVAKGTVVAVVEEP